MKTFVVRWYNYWDPSSRRNLTAVIAKTKNEANAQLIKQHGTGIVIISIKQIQ